MLVVVALMPCARVDCLVRLGVVVVVVASERRPLTTRLTTGVLVVVEARVRRFRITRSNAVVAVVVAANALPRTVALPTTAVEVVVALIDTGVRFGATLNATDPMALAGEAWVFVNDAEWVIVVPEVATN